MTLADRLNMKDTQAYARLIRKAAPTYIEAKAYMHVGYSRLRLTYRNMPSHTEIKQFAQQLAQKTNYALIDESAESRVVLLSQSAKKDTWTTANHLADNSQIPRFKQQSAYSTNQYEKRTQTESQAFSPVIAPSFTTDHHAP